MKKFLITLILLTGISILGYSSLKYYLSQQSNKEKNQKILKDLSIARAEILLYYKTYKKLPEPDYTIETYSGITKGLYCKYKEPYYKRCYVYAKQKEKFQIAGIIKTNTGRQSVLTGNSSKPLIKDWKTNYFVKDKDIKYFPYNPTGTLSQGVVLDCSGKLVVNNKTIKNCKNYIIKPDDIVKITGKISILLTDGRKITIQSAGNQPAIFSLKDKLKQETDIFLVLGKLINQIGQIDVETPYSNYLIFRNNILEAHIEKDNYFLSLQKNNQKIKISAKILQNNINQSSLKTDILNPQKIENLIILEK